MSGDAVHLRPFLKTLLGPMMPDGTYDGLPGRQRYVAVYYVDGMVLPVGAELRGSWVVPPALAGPVQPLHPHGLLPVLRQQVGGGDVAGHNLRVEQARHMDRVETSGKFFIVLGYYLC